MSEMKRDILTENTLENAVVLDNDVEIEDNTVVDITDDAPIIVGDYEDTTVLEVDTEEINLYDEHSEVMVEVEVDTISLYEDNKEETKEETKPDDTDSEDELKGVDIWQSEGKYRESEHRKYKNRIGKEAERRLESQYIAQNKTRRRVRFVKRKIQDLVKFIMNIIIIAIIVYVVYTNPTLKEMAIDMIEKTVDFLRVLFEGGDVKNTELIKDIGNVVNKIKR